MHTNIRQFMWGSIRRLMISISIPDTKITLIIFYNSSVNDGKFYSGGNNFSKKNVNIKMERSNRSNNVVDRDTASGHNPEISEIIASV